MKKLLTILVVGMAFVLTLGSAYAMEVFRSPTELIYHDVAKTQDGYILHWPMKEKNIKYDDPIGTLYLIDVEGQVIHTWPGLENNPKLYPDGKVRNNNQAPTNTAWVEMAWDGTKTALFPAVSQGDNWMIWNKKLKQYTYIGTYRGTYSAADIIAAGGDPSLPYTGMTGESIIEYDKTGKIIWQWRFLDHVIQDKNPAWPNYVGAGKAIKDYPGKQNLFHQTDHGVARGLSGITPDWHHVNSMDYNEDLGLIALNSKHWSEFYVIDHDNTFVAGDPAASIALAKSSKGDFLYRFGKPSAYGQGLPPGFQTEGNQQIYGAHNIQWIRPYAWRRPIAEAGDKWQDPATLQGTALPGAGNFLIFDNGIYNPVLAHSKILEINPYISGVDKATGKPIIGTVMVNPPDAGYKSNGLSNQVVWSYQSILPNSFFAQSQSGMNRLPNGNTHIHSANNGHMFQVTPAGEVVWEYLNPVSSFTGPQLVQTEGLTNGRDFDEHRSVWYPKNHPAFAGKDVSQKGTITGRGASGTEYMHNKLDIFLEAKGF